jgi:hypothetical protein
VIANTSDVVNVSLAGERLHSVVFEASEQALNKQLSISLTSFDKQRRYELSNLQLQGKQRLQLQHDNACRSVRLQSAGQPVTFDLQLFVKGKPAAVMSKQVSFPADIALNLSPVDWVALEQGAGEPALELQIMNPLDGKVMETRRI